MSVERNRRPYANVIETIGWTPLIRLNAVTRGIRPPVYAKAEFYNPGGSVKDRIGLPIIERAEREGNPKPGGTIVEGTSGNTGVALPIAAALRGYKAICTMPDQMSHEQVRVRKPLRAVVSITPTARPPANPHHYFTSITTNFFFQGNQPSFVEPDHIPSLLLTEPISIGADIVIIIMNIKSEFTMKTAFCQSNQ